MRRAMTVVTVAAIGVVGSAQADTTDVQWQNRVVVEKEGVHCADDPNCFNRYHPAIEPVARARPGDFIVFESRDALDTDLTLESNADDVAALDLNLVHPMTGPVHIEGAERGDVLAVTLVDIEPDQFGYTIVVPGFGFLRDMFTEPVFVGWQLSRSHAVSDQMPGVRVPMAAFMGSVGVLPGEEEVAAWLEREAELAEIGGSGGGLRSRRQPQGPVPAHHPAARERRQHGRAADADRYHAAPAVLHRRLRAVRRRRPLRAGRRRGLRHGHRDGCGGDNPHRGHQGRRR
jgi:formamidase